MAKAWTPLILVMAACGGTDAGEAVPADPVLPGQQVVRAPAPTPGVPTGTVYDVQMTRTPDGRFVFVPADLVIRQGDAVRWVNVSEGPHNVAFYPDRIPVGAAQVLAAAIDDRLPGVPLAANLVSADHATIEISFAGAPTGTYRYYCTPHEMLGMQATITVTP